MLEHEQQIGSNIMGSNSVGSNMMMGSAQVLVFVSVSTLCFVCSCLWLCLWMHTCLQVEGRDAPMLLASLPRPLAKFCARTPD